MATMNPLERKARQSLVKGLLIAGVIGLLGIAFLTIQLIRVNGEEAQRVAAQKDVIVLKQPVRSGDIVTSAMTIRVKADADVAPGDALKAIGEDMIAKIDLNASTILTENMLAMQDNMNTDDVRKQEYNMISLPADIETGETIDIRLRMPDGTDYIVVSKKLVTVLDEAGIPSLNTISLELSEGETLMLNNAIVESYQMKGSKLYVTRYVEPGLQAGAITTYIPNSNVQNLIAANPNIVMEAKQALINRINEQGGLNRGNINNELNSLNADTRSSYVEAGTSSEITTQRDERQKYLDGLGG